MKKIVIVVALFACAVCVGSNGEHVVSVVAKNNKEEIQPSAFQELINRYDDIKGDAEGLQKRYRNTEHVTQAMCVVQQKQPIVYNEYLSIYQECGLRYGTVRCSEVESLIISVLLQTQQYLLKK